MCDYWCYIFQLTHIISVMYNLVYIVHTENLYYKSWHEYFQNIASYLEDYT